jgi:hypothetical protein
MCTVKSGAYYLLHELDWIFSGGVARGPQDNVQRSSPTVFYSALLKNSSRLEFENKNKNYYDLPSENLEDKIEKICSTIYRCFVKFGKW